MLETVHPLQGVEHSLESIREGIALVWTRTEGSPAWEAEGDSAEAEAEGDFVEVVVDFGEAAVVANRS
jgi:hypothetical protein